MKKLKIRPMTYNPRPKNGFTLIEVLLYSFLVTTILTFILLATYQIIDNQGRSGNWLELQENSQFFLQKLEWVLQNNSAINLPVAGATSSSLSVNKINFGSNPLVMDLAGSMIRLKQGGGLAVNLTSPNLAVSALSFGHQNLSGKVFIKVSAKFLNATASTSVDTLIFVR